MFPPSPSLEFITRKIPDALQEFQNSLQSDDHSFTLKSAFRILFECTLLGRPIHTFRFSGKISPLAERLRQLEEQPGEDISTKDSDILDMVDGTLCGPYGRRLFTAVWPNGTRTRKGLGPTFTQTEDKIAILHGARFPVILRTVDSESQKYQVVGDCYIEGIMYGEAVTWKEEKDANDILLV